jgi:hypothetical protein
MSRFPDDDWRQILEANGFHPSGAREEVWRNPYSDLKVQIDVDRETEEPYYQIIAEDGTRGEQQNDSEALKKIVEPKEPEPPYISDEEFMQQVGIKRDAGKRAGRPARFSFVVPIDAGGAVAFQLAKAGLEGFEATNYRSEDEGVTEFRFPTEPEMHVGEEIVKQEFDEQIKHHEDWYMWQAQPEDPAQVKGERELEQGKQYVSSLKTAGQWGERSYDSDQVHDVLDQYRRKPNDPGGEESQGFDEPVAQEMVGELLQSLDDDPSNGATYLGVIVFLMTHGSEVPPAFVATARRIAQELVNSDEYLQTWKDPEARREELQHELEFLSK